MNPPPTEPATPSDQAPTPLSRLREALFRPVDLASLAVFRLGFGVVLLWLVSQYLGGGRLERSWLDPVLLFRYPGFEGLRPLSDQGMHLLFWVLGAAAAGIALGLGYRVSCMVFALGYGYSMFLDAARFQNHTYLICLLALLMALVPAHRMLSPVAHRRGDPTPTAPAWALWLLRFQVAIPYVYGGLAKLNGDWMLRAEPMAMWLREGTEGSAWNPIFEGAWAGYFFAWGGVALDLAIVPLLLWRRTRWAAFLVVTAFHVTNSWLFNIGVFPWMMIWATLLFFPPDWPRRVGLLRDQEGAKAKKKGGRRRGGKAQDPATADPGRAPRWAVLTFLALWVGFQLLFPFRHFLYPGNVDWTEEGHRFSWRMKLRDKRGDVRFVAVDSAARRVLPLEDAESVLTPFQWAMMTHDPEMMRQLAVFLRQRLRDAGYPGVEVRAVTSISLNGRPAQPLVDPEADLSRVSARSRDWIEPLESAFP